MSKEERLLALSFAKLTGRKAYYLEGKKVHAISPDGSIELVTLDMSKNCEELQMELVIDDVEEYLKKLGGK